MKCPNCGKVINIAEHQDNPDINELTIAKTLLKIKRVDMGVDIPY